MEQKISSSSISGVPLLTIGVITAPRLDIGWPTVHPAAELKDIAGPFQQLELQGDTIPINEILSPQAITDSMSVYTKVNQLVEDIVDYKIGYTEYVHHVEELIGDNDKYQLYATAWPGTLIPYTLTLNDIGIQPEPTKIVDPERGNWYGGDGKYGARIQVYDAKKVIEQVLLKLEVSEEVVLDLLYNDRHNALVFNQQTKTIDRYEPEASSEDLPQRNIDVALYAFFKEFLPNFTYNRHRLFPNQQVGVKYNKNLGLLDVICYDMMMLYIKLRVSGFNHIDAALTLVEYAGTDTMIGELQSLYMELHNIYNNL